MDQGRTEDAEELSRAMEDSRASISETVGEIREAVTHAIDWRERVKGHPGASLGIAAGTGLIVGRWIGGKITRSDMPRRMSGEASAWTRPSHPTSLGASQMGPRMLDGSIHRAASRAESLVNRVIDEVADAVEAGALVPLFSRLRGFLYSSASAARRSEEWPESETTRDRNSSTGERRGVVPGAAAERGFTPGTPAGRAVTPSATASVTPGSPVGSTVTPGASAGRGVTAGTPAGWADTHAVGTPE